MNEELKKRAELASEGAGLAELGIRPIKPSKQKLKHYNAAIGKALTTMNAESFADSKATNRIGSSNQNVAVTEGNTIYW